MHMLHLGDSEDDEMEFSDVPSPRASAAAHSSAAAAQSHSGTRPRPLSSEAVEDAEDGEESKPRTHRVSRMHASLFIEKCPFPWL